MLREQVFMGSGPGPVGRPGMTLIFPINCLIPAGWDALRSRTAGVYPRAGEWSDRWAGMGK